jgi:two-component system sensor histidine kinase PilS (NtrC family)
MKLFNLRLEHSVDVESWRAFTALAGYRLFLAISLFVVYDYNLPPDFLGEHNPSLYELVSQFYLVTAAILFIFASQKWGYFESQAKIHLLIDIIVIALIIYASGGLKTGLGSLLVVVVVAGGVLVPGPSAGFIAAVAALAILVEAIYSDMLGDVGTKYSNAGMLGATFFVIALLAQSLARKMQSSQRLAAQRADDVAKLAGLNERIINRMQTGVLVVNQFGAITLSNASAKKMLNIDEAWSNPSLKDHIPRLAEQLWAWKHNQANAFKAFQAGDGLPEVTVRASSLESGETLLFIEDTTAVAQQVQQLKLASLGQLTASIAHEIRNPLSAISHAGELLAEQSDQNTSYKKLTDIIQRHCDRVNGIIEMILQMSRRKIAEPVVIVLVPWLERFINEFCESTGATLQDIELVSNAALVKIQTDDEQFRQVLWNLVDNAWQFSDPEQAEPRVRIRLSQRDDEVIIDVSDNGPGVSEKVQAHLFEPFYSDRQGGTGLGLYLAKALCQANGARLSYLSDYQERCCFRMNYPINWQERIQ